jgi:hypothetical protein
MSAILASIPPSSRPGLAKAYGLPSFTHQGDCYDRATPRELKAEAIRLFPLCGLGKREAARKFKRSKSAVQYWLDPDARDRTPPVSFVRFLRNEVDYLESNRAYKARLAEVLAR